MKKIILLFSALSLIMLSSCSSENGKDGINGTNGKDGVNIQGEAYEIKNFNYAKDRTVNDGTSYFYAKTFNTPLDVSDNIFVYKLVATVDNQTPIWVALPKSWNVNGGFVSYDFYFSKVQCYISMYGNLDLGTLPDWTNNQTLRILVVPSKIMSQANFKKNDYNSVLNAIHVDETEVKILN